MKAIWIEYENAVEALEHEGLDRSDAQAEVDLKFNDLYGMGWEVNKPIK